MSKTRVDDLHEKWMRSPGYRKEYAVLEEEFARTRALMEARGRAEGESWEEESPPEEGRV